MISCGPRRIAARETHAAKGRDWREEKCCERHRGRKCGRRVPITDGGRDERRVARIAAAKTHDEECLDAFDASATRLFLLEQATKEAGDKRSRQVDDKQSGGCEPGFAGGFWQRACDDEAKHGKAEYGENIEETV